MYSVVLMSNSYTYIILEFHSCFQGIAEALRPHSREVSFGGASGHTAQVRATYYCLLTVEQFSAKSVIG